MEEVDKGCPMIRMGVSGWMFLLVPAYPGCPGQKAVKQLCVCVEGPDDWQGTDRKNVLGGIAWHSGDATSNMFCDYQPQDQLLNGCACVNLH